MNIKTIAALAASLIAASAIAGTTPEKKCGAGSCSKKGAHAKAGMAASDAASEAASDAACSKKDKEASCSKKEASCSKKGAKAGAEKEASCSKK
jgi:hypothetical protein